MDRIQELQARIEALKAHQPENSSVWGVLDENMKGITGAQAAVINARESVKTAQADMMYAFVNFFLFPKYRDEFASISTFRPLCDKYISAAINAKDESIKESVELAEENKRLKAELARLKK